MAPLSAAHCRQRLAGREGSASPPAAHRRAGPQGRSDRLARRLSCRCAAPCGPRIEWSGPAAAAGAEGRTARWLAVSVTRSEKASMNGIKRGELAITAAQPASVTRKEDAERAQQRSKTCPQHNRAAAQQGPIRRRSGSPRWLTPLPAVQQCGTPLGAPCTGNAFMLD